MARGGGRFPQASRPTDVRRILVDGRNVQGAIARGTVGGSVPTHVFIAQLRAAAPPGATLELVLDGFPSGGVIGRVGPYFEVSYTRHRSADEAIADRVAAAAAELGPIGVDGILVVSDDRAVGDQARLHGAQVVGTAWLTDRIRAGSRSGSTLGQGRPPLGHGRPPRTERHTR